MKPVRKAIIPAAGYGTRFLPQTKALPKEMTCVVDKPSIQYIVEEAYQSGIEEILIIIARQKGSIEDHFDLQPELEAHLISGGKMELVDVIKAPEKMAKFHYVRQSTMLGLGQAIGLGRSFAKDEPFAVLLPDDIVAGQVPALKQLINAYDAYGTSIVGVQEVALDQIHKYGAIAGELIGERSYKVSGMVEKPSAEEAPSRLAILGRYILTPGIFDALDRTPRGKGGEIQLTDGIRLLMESETVMAYDFEGKRYDTGDKLGYLKATVEFALGHPELGEAFHKYLKSLVHGLNM